MRAVWLLAFVVLLSGCTSEEPTLPSSATPVTPSGAQVTDFRGQTLTLLDHGAFAAFGDAKALFEEATGATVVRVSANDAGGVLQRAIQERGDPTFDVIYGIDNILWTKAVDAGIFEPYTPERSGVIDPAYLFFPEEATWPATPVDHGYIAVNVDERTLNASIASLDDLKLHAAQFVTQDPRTSTPGLGFLLATIATYGEDGWRPYWSVLFENGLLVTSGWSEAYEQHFTAGYGVDYGGAADRAIVTSYTESPAYEAFFGRPLDTLAVPLVAPNATFHQIQTMGIARGTDHLALAQAWLDFTLTPGFQTLAASGNAVYPVVKGIDANDTYGEIDPEPGSFEPAALTSDEIGANLERWLRAWTDLCEQHDCA